MIYLSYLRHLNLVGGNSCITSISFAQLATNGEVNVGRHNSCLYHKKKSFESALNVPFLWENPVTGAFLHPLAQAVHRHLPSQVMPPRFMYLVRNFCRVWLIHPHLLPRYLVWFSPRGHVKPKIPSTTLVEEYGHLHTGRQARE